MNDLDTALRAMLQDRAHDITTVPESIVSQLDGGVDVHLVDGRRRRTAPHSVSQRTTWLVAASIAAVLAIVGVMIATGGSGAHRSTPPSTRSVVPPTPTPTPTTATVQHIQSQVSLSWFGMADLPGFALHMRESLPGFQWLAVRSNADTGTPIGCNGCESASDYIYVFAKGHFDNAKNGVASGQPVTVGGTPATYGQALEHGSRNHTMVPSIAWQFRPGEWVLVQGVTPLGGTEESLLAVANAVRPTQSTPILLPCTFGYLPAMPITDIMDDRSEGYAFNIEMGDTGGRSFAITLWNGSGWPYYSTTGMTRQDIGGLPGYYGTQQGAGVLYHGGGMAFSFGDGQGGPLTAADDAETYRVIAGITWANADGRAPLVPLTKAIP
jgi:hypothetical protein